ncbi:cysteine hydrolase family protein [Sinomonas susongensis]|uniref:cysteine hydrolase family protein n=1 Tax=Sinomonas susongensis TaxID=1324851 RepID=UPI001108277E|nr:cysteine hydrolase [Sinomonas susongensis]
MKTALLVIDMENAFFENAALAAQRDRLVGACNELIAAARESDARILLLRTEHERDRSTWTLSMLDDEQGFAFHGTEQAELLPELDTAGLPQLVKRRDSAFWGTDLFQRLHTWEVEQLLLAGVSTHLCLAQTASDAYAHNFRVAFAGDAMGAESPDRADAMLDVLLKEYRQAKLTQEEALALLRG